jgi:hypothetical protein
MLSRGGNQEAAHSKDADGCKQCDSRVFLSLKCDEAKGSSNKISRYDRSSLMFVNTTTPTGPATQ